MAADDASRALDSLHDTDSEKELGEINKLQKTEQDRYHWLIKAEENLASVINSNSGNQAVVDAQKGLDANNIAYDRAVKNLQDFINKKKKIQNSDRIIQAKGIVKTLNGELEETEAANGKLISLFDKRRISLLSGFEDEKDKATRIHKEKSTTLQAAYDKQLASQDSLVKKEKELFKESIKSNNIQYNEKIRLARVSGAREHEIIQLKDDLRYKNQELEINHNNTMAELNDAELTAKINHGDTIVAAEKGLIDKLAKIDQTREAKAKAKLLREERANKKIINAAKKRAKLLRDFEGGNSKQAKITQKYEDDVAAYQSAEFTKQEAALAGYESIAQMVDDLVTMRGISYDNDVAKFRASEANKTIAAREEAAIRAGADFKKDADIGVAKQEDGASGVESFFGVNFNEIAEKQAELKAIKTSHIEEMTQLAVDGKIDEQEKLARIAEIEREHAIKQADLKKEGRKQAEADTWNAINTLGASGSKKAFALAKAANIGKTVMNTAQAVSNALANIPTPFNIPAAIAIGAAGLVQVNNIKRQKMPQFHDGITDVPRSGSYLLDQGERVLSSKLNADLKEDLARRNNGSSGDSQPTNINLTLPDTANYNAVEQWYEDNSDRIVAHVQYAMNRP